MRWILKIILFPIRLLLSILTAFLTFLLGIGTTILYFLMLMCIVAAIGSFIQKDYKAKTIADLQEKISTLQSQNKKISQDIKAKTTRIENLNKCFAYADIIKDNKKVFEEWNSKSLFKDSFYNSHKDEIDKYKRARAILEKITGSSAIKSKDWKKEIQSLEDEISKLNRQSQSIKEEYESINHIKYAVKTVNDDYGIDLSIEIDKAIKRGEKPSVIAQIKKYQEQQEKYEKKKERTKDIYRNSER